MKKITLLFAMLFLLALTSEMKAQDYKSAIGLRLGYPISISYKTFLTEFNALELYAGFRSYSGVYGYFTVGGLYEIHKPIGDVDGLSWYYGGGASVQFFTYDNAYNFDDDNGSFGVGISGVIGLDYKFPTAPFNLSLDFMPTFRLGGWDDGYYSWGALSARYVLN
ncbi:MAG: hypothetical protein U5K79_18305 [Cyclobacteriaceae bacterium]|nr:hypothetical protein [Cyclobacteriaceae bacterium]